MRHLILLSALLLIAACQTVPAGSDLPYMAQQAEAQVAEAEEATTPRDPELLRAEADTLREEAIRMDDAIIALNDALSSAGAERAELVTAYEAAETEDDAAAIEAQIKDVDSDIEALYADGNAIASQIPLLIARSDALYAEAEALELELAEANPPVQLVQDETDAQPNAFPVPMPVPARPDQSFLDYNQSELVLALLSEELREDDVAIMGIVSGARSYCGMGWQQGFVNFMQIAADNGWDLNQIANEHGLFMGAARRALQDVSYVCNIEDAESLDIIYP